MRLVLEHIILYQNYESELEWCIQSDNPNSFKIGSRNLD